MALALVALAVQFAGLRFGWGWVERVRLEQRLSTLRQMDETARDESRAIESIQTDDNAALLYEQAAQALVFPQQLKPIFDDYAGYPDLAEKYRFAFERVFSDNAAVLELIRAARSRPAAFWPSQSLVRPPFASDPHVTSQTSLGGLTAAAALFAIRNGDSAEGIERLRDLTALADHVLRDAPSLNEQFVGLSTVLLTSRTLERILPTLDLEQPRDSAATVEVRNATRAQVEALRDALLAEQVHVESLYRALQGERLLRVSAAARLSESRWPSQALAATIATDPAAPAWFNSPWSVLLFGPLIDRDVLGLLEVMTACVEAARQPLYSAAVAELQRLQRPADPLAELKRPLRDLLHPRGIDRTLLLHFRVLAERRMAAIGLALCLYTADHGAPAESLDQLIPAYLPNIPADPFSREPAWIRYVPGDEPRLYSVFENGADDGGWWSPRAAGASAVPSSTGMVRAAPARFQLDWIFSLNDRRPQRPRTSTNIVLPPGYDGSSQAQIEDQKE